GCASGSSAAIDISATIRRPRPLSCAHAASGQAAAPPSIVMNSRRLMGRTPRPRITDASIAGQARASQQKRPAHVPVGVIHDPGGRSFTTVHVRFAPKSDIILGSLPPPTLGECRHRGSPTRLLPTCLRGLVRAGAAGSSRHSMRPYIGGAASNSAHEIAIEAVGPEAVWPCVPQAQGEGALLTV